LLCPTNRARSPNAPSWLKCRKSRNEKKSETNRQERQAVFVDAYRNTLVEGAGNANPTVLTDRDPTDNPFFVQTSKILEFSNSPRDHGRHAPDGHQLGQAAEVQRRETRSYSIRRTCLHAVGLRQSRQARCSKRSRSNPTILPSCRCGERQRYLKLEPHPVQPSGLTCSVCYEFRGW
jgi:hypothetical protein